MDEDNNEPLDETYYEFVLGEEHPAGLVWQMRNLYDMLVAMKAEPLPATFEQFFEDALASGEFTSDDEAE